MSLRRIMTSAWYRTAQTVGMAATLALAGWACAGAGDPARVASARCADLAAMRLIDFSIVSASQVADGDAVPHCRVQGLVDDEINFELLLLDAWNGRFMMGGGQGTMESQRYPDDFDGIVAGAPAYHWTAFTAGFVQNQQAIFPDASDLSAPVITPENRALLDASIRDACDHLDGVADGVLTDPRRCRFTPESLPRCAADASGPDCVTSDQLAAIQTIYAGPTSAGAQIFPGFPLGGENDPGGWDRWIAGATGDRGVPNLHYGFGTELYKYFVFDDPDWDYTHYDFSTWADDVAETATLLDATEPDLGPFRDAGGKLILWTGWSDPALTALGTIDYYEQVIAGDPSAREYARLFMLPGVLHCGGGPGPDQVDWLTAIAAWVEEGEPPIRLVAAKRGAEEETAPVLTRPVCAFPQVAVYTGSGSTDDEENFQCQAD